MPPGPRSVQTEVNATRILLRGPDGHLHLMQKALANGPRNPSPHRRADRHSSAMEATWSSCWQHELQCRAGVAGHAGPQASGRIPMPGEVGVAHRDPGPRPSRSSTGWYSGECLDTHSGDVSRVYVTKRKILLFFSVLAGDSQDRKSVV